MQGTVSPTVTIIIVSFNTRELTLDCLRSVFAETRSTFQVVVLDNASNDGSAEAIDAEFAGRIRLVRSKSNLGFARANNFVAESAQSEYLLLLNPDTVILNAAIDRLLEFAVRRPDSGIWGGRTVDGSGRLDPTSCWARMTPRSVACMAFGLSTLLSHSPWWNSEGMGGWLRDSERAVDIVTGCFLLIKTSLWRQLRGFNPLFFMYGEEADLCLRAINLGYQPCFTPQAEIIHLGGASERVRADQLVRLLKAKTQLQCVHWSPTAAKLGRLMLQIWVLRSYFQRRLNPRGRDLAKAWREVWDRRSEWLCNGPSSQKHLGEIG